MGYNNIEVRYYEIEAGYMRFRWDIIGFEIEAGYYEIEAG